MPRLRKGTSDINRLLADTDSILQILSVLDDDVYEVKADGVSKQDQAKWRKIISNFKRIKSECDDFGRILSRVQVHKSSRNVRKGGIKNANLRVVEEIDDAHGYVSIADVKMGKIVTALRGMRGVIDQDNAGRALMHMAKTMRSLTGGITKTRNLIKKG